MTTIIQSCFETQFIETTTVKLKVASQNSSPSSSCNSGFPLEMKGGRGGGGDLGGWSFLQALSDNVSSNPASKMEEENVYVPSTSKMRLTEKSLELCTENLGCETGSRDITLDCNILSLSLSPSISSSRVEILSPKLEQNHEHLPTTTNHYPAQGEEYSKSYLSSPKNNMVNNNSSRKFPPPLTSMSNGSSSLQFRPHREDGRLVITAMEAPTKHTYFRAERSQGRLRLTFLEDHAPKFDSQVSDNEVDGDADADVDNEEEKEEEGCEERVKADHDFIIEEDHHQLDEDDGDDDGESGAYMIKDMNGNRFEIEVDLGMEKFQRLINSRCNEGGHHTKVLCNWREPLWVATS